MTPRKAPTNGELSLMIENLVFNFNESNKRNEAVVLEIKSSVAGLTGAVEENTLYRVGQTGIAGVKKVLFRSIVYPSVMLVITLVITAIYQAIKA